MAEAVDSIIGRSIGGFLVERLLGEGGFARVYLARRLSDGCPAALKLLTGRTDVGSTDLRRFEREAKLVARLNAPGTIRVLAHGRDDNHFYIAFELVDGEGLDVVLQRGPLAPAQAEAIFRTMLQSLEEAHRLGVLHRDIKPANIMLGRDGRPKLLDFGVAHVQADVLQMATQLTGAGMVLGTVQYMCPENILQKSLTPASDLYSLGLVAYEMLTGKPVVAADTVFNMVRQHTDQTVFELPPGPWPPRLRSAVDACLRKSVSERPASAAKVLAILDERATSSGSSHEPQAAPAARPSRRSVAIGIAATLVIGGLVGLWLSPEKTVAPPHRGVDVARTEALIQRPAVASPADPVDSPKTSDDACDPSRRVEPGTVTLGAVDGLSERTWYVHVPTSYRPGIRHAVVLMFHDLRKPTVEFVHDTKFDALADEHAFIVLAMSDPGMMPWQTVDTGRISEALDVTSVKYCVDRTRIFAIGHGGGGRAAERIACTLPLRAFATTAFRSNAGEEPCEPYKPTPYLQIAPLEDGFAPVEGGSGCGLDAKRPLADEEAMWRERNRCNGPERQHAREPGGTCVAWDCAAPLIACRVEGGRMWPGMTDFLTDREGCGRAGAFPRAEVIWSFFEAAMAWRVDEAGAATPESR